MISRHLRKYFTLDGRQRIFSLILENSPLKNHVLSKKHIHSINEAPISENHKNLPRNFFSEKLQFEDTWRKISKQHYLKMKTFLNNCVDLETKKLTNKIPEGFDGLLYRFPSAAKYFGDFDDLEKSDLLQKWWLIFSSNLKRVDPITCEPLYNAEEISRCLNAVLTGKKGDEKNVLVENLGPKPIQILIEAVLQSPTTLSSRSFAMFLRNVYNYMTENSLPNLIEESSKVHTEIETPDWIKDRLNQFSLKFYATLPDIGNLDKNDLSSYIAKDNVIMAMFLLYRFDSKLWCAKETLKILAHIFCDVLDVENPHIISQERIMRFIRLGKVLKMCHEWDFDIGSIAFQNHTDARQFWDNIFLELQFLTEKDTNVRNQKMITYTMFDALLIALKYKYENLFVKHLANRWQTVMFNRSCISSSAQKKLAMVIRNGDYGAESKKISDKEIFMRVMSLIEK